jgi:pilus assembly protein CpaF
VQIAEVVGIEDGMLQTENIFEFARQPGSPSEVRGEFRATGYMPSFLEDFIALGLCADGEYL